MNSTVLSINRPRGSISFPRVCYMLRLKVRAINAGLPRNADKCIHGRVRAHERVTFVDDLRSFSPPAAAQTALALTAGLPSVGTAWTDQAATAFPSGETSEDTRAH
jgi:hypothetical protein